MGSHHVDGLLHYSGYDEYSGIFGPLQTTSSSSYHSQDCLPLRRRRFPNSRNPEISSQLRNGRKPATRTFDRRAKFLARRRAKSAFQPLEEDSDGVENLQNKEHDPKSPLEGLQRQVWLPTRNFTFRQRAGKLDIRAIARLNLEKIAATTDIETIQRHLENLTFADVTLDDVQQYSDAYFLKLFQIAQLTLEYLMHVQDSLVDHSEGLEKQCEQLMTECQQLEVDNEQHETELTSLKREIQQKQRTMATLELMLLNASASNRDTFSAKENAAQKANELVDELLAKRTDSVPEEGSINQPVSCVLCGKRFVSAEYLLRHQQRRHQDAAKSKGKKKKQKTGSSFGSSSDSDSKRKAKKKAGKTASIPKEILEALEEKNQLAKQFMALQEQVHSDQEARERQRQQIESQQNRMSSRVEQCMEKLQATFLEIERKQEATKQDLQQQTHEVITRLQVEAARAEVMRIQAQKTSRAGTLENDDGEARAKSKSDDASWNEKVDRMMDSFLRAQAQKQQEIDALTHESSKLWAKYHKLKKKTRPETTMRLADLTALDTERFGIDRGEVEELETPKPVRPDHIFEDKLVQTDDDDTGKHLKQQQKPVTPTQEAQEDLESRSPSVVELPVKLEAIEVIKQRSCPTPEKEEHLVVSPPSVVEQNSKAKLEHAAQVIERAALRFLAHRALVKTSNWSISLVISSLETILTAPELEYVREHYDSQIHIQVEETMTANDLRVSIARALSGNDEFDTKRSGIAAFDNSYQVTATMTYHRVLLHHQQTGTELSGDMLIHELKNVIDVEIIPYHEMAAMQVNEVIESHAISSDRLKSIQLASMKLEASTLDDKTNEPKKSPRDTEVFLARLVRLQALARGFLAKKNVQLMRIDRLMDARVVRLKSPQNAEFSDFKPIEPSWMSLDPVLAAEYRKAQKRLTQALCMRLHTDDSDEEALRLLLSADYKKHLDELTTEQNCLPSSVQQRIQLLTERLTPMALSEFRLRESNSIRSVASRSVGAAKIHRAVQVEIVRKRLKRLLMDGSKGASPSLTTTLGQENKETGDKSLVGFDPNEIDQLANAYEEGNSFVESELQSSENKDLVLPISVEDLGSKQDEGEEASRLPTARVEIGVAKLRETKPQSQPNTL